MQDNGTAIYYDGFEAHSRASAAGSANWDAAPLCTYDPESAGSQIDASGEFASTGTA